MADRCAVPNCRGEVALVYLDHGICNNHWNQLADDDTRPELRVVLGLDASASPAMEERTMPENTIATDTVAAEETMKTENAKAKSPKKTRAAKSTAKKAAKGKAAKVAKPVKEAKAKKERTARERPGDRTFAVRVSSDELAAIHAAAGPRNATRFARAALAAFANGDTKAFETVLKEARAARG